MSRAVGPSEVTGEGESEAMDSANAFVKVRTKWRAVAELVVRRRFQHHRNTSEWRFLS